MNTNSVLAKEQINQEGHPTWLIVQDKLKEKFGTAAYKSWLSGLEFVETKGSNVVLTAPTRFIREWILTHYRDAITHCWQQEDKAVMSVDIFVRLTQGNAPKTEMPMQVASGVDVAGQNVAILQHDTQHWTHQIATPLDRRFTFDNFVADDSNNLAYAAAQAVSQANTLLPGTSPLYIHGGVGLGKTHLLHAIAWHIRQHQPEKRVLYLSAERFMYQFIKALRDKDILSFKSALREVDVFLFDDIQFICGKGSTQEEFFHTFNALTDNNRQMIIAGDRPPCALGSISEQMRSRLNSGLVVDIGTTNNSLRVEILKSKLKLMETTLSEDVVTFIASKISSNVRELEGALNKVVAHSTLTGQETDLAKAKDILSDLLRANERVVTVDMIQKKVAEFFGIKVSDMRSARRARTIARPRQIAMYLAKQLTSRSLPDIGRKFGGKDHTTVMHAVKRVEELSVKDREFADNVRLLMQALKSGS